MFSVSFIEILLESWTVLFKVEMFKYHRPCSDMNVTSSFSSECYHHHSDIAHAAHQLDRLPSSPSWQPTFADLRFVSCLSVHFHIHAWRSHVAHNASSSDRRRWTRILELNLCFTWPRSLAANSLCKCARVLVLILCIFFLRTFKSSLKFPLTFYGNMADVRCSPKWWKRHNNSAVKL